MPFSSALQAAEIFGIACVYYDSQRQYQNIYSEKKYNVARGYPELSMIVSAWLDSASTSDFGSIADFQMTFAREIGVR